MSAATQRVLYLRRKALRRCVKCGARTEGGVYCEPHREKLNEIARNKYRAETRGRYRK